MRDLLFEGMEQKAALAMGGVRPNPSIECVTHNRKAERRQVHADLVPAARHELHPQQRSAALEGQLAHDGLGGLPLPRSTRAHAARIMPVSTYGGINHLLFPRKAAGNDSQVDLAHGMACDLRIKHRLCRSIKREEHEARGVNVKALHRLGAHVGTALGRKVFHHKVRQRADARAVSVHEDACRLICHQQNVILVDYFDRLSQVALPQAGKKLVGKLVHGDLGLLVG